jgi:mono/diheme cytochrome c family protein
VSNRPSSKPSPSIQRAAAARVAGANQPRVGGTTWLVLAAVTVVLVAVGTILVLTRSSTPDAPVLDAQAQRGQQLSRDKGCISCHTSSGDRSEGPTWKGIYGKPVTLTDGSTVVVDDAYISRSIKEPRSQVVAEYLPMATPKPMTDEEIAAVTAYIKALAP